MSGQLIYRKDGDYMQTGSNSFSVNLPPTTPKGAYLAVIRSDKNILKLFKVVKAQ
jgi:hypothetical protein